MNKNEKLKMIDLLEGLVGCVQNQDEMGGCVWCGGSGKEGRYGYCDESYDCHEGDCAWVAGNKMLKSLRDQV